MSLQQKPVNALVSVLMAVHNGQDTVRGSIESILAQTAGDFEFIIVDDGSTDRTPAILAEYAQKDPRICVHMKPHSGLTKSLNHGIALAKGRYIARQDADDISFPHRLERQLRFMENNPEISLCGSNAEDSYPDGHTELWGWHDPVALQKIVYLKTPFPHSTAMFRTDACRALGGYDESFRTAQDMELWMRFAKSGMIYMLEEPLLRRSVLASSISGKRRWRQARDGFRARWKHRPGLAAPYHTTRSLLISLLPHNITHKLRKALKP